MVWDKILGYDDPPPNRKRRAGDNTPPIVPIVPVPASISAPPTVTNPAPEPITSPPISEPPTA